MIPEIYSVGQNAVLYAQARSEQVFESIGKELGEKYEYETQDGYHSVRFFSDHGEILAKGHPVASVAVDPATLLWRWNEGENSAAAAYRRFGEQLGLTSFTSQEVPYQQGPAPILQVATDVGYCAFEIFGPNSMYMHVPINEAGSRIVVLLDSFSRPIPEFTLQDLVPKLPRLLSQFVQVADVSMQGLARQRPDWTVTQIEPSEDFSSAWRIADQSGYQAEAHILLDEYGRVTSVRVIG